MLQARVLRWAAGRPKRSARRGREFAWAGGLCVAFAAAASAADPPASQPTHDWPMWGGSPTRNAVAAATGIPAQWDVSKKRNIRWSSPLGTYTYGGPVISGGRIFIGTNNGGGLRPSIKDDQGCVVCLDQRTGEFLWQATHAKLDTGPAQDWPEQGVASTPLVVGDRVYYVSNRCELVCATVTGLQSGRNEGPYTSEKHTTPQDADFVWILDMIAELGVYPHNLAACSPVAGGDLIFVCTGNGVDDEHEKPPAPQAPSFIAVDGRTGKVVWMRNDPGEHILHGQWSSPAYGVIAGQPQVIFGGGDGWCYAFEPKTGAPLWKFNLNPPDTKWEIGGSGTMTSIVATPVIAGDRVYLASGDDPEQCHGPGHLYAIDATQRGDITAKGQVWHVGGKDFGRTIASVAVADGLLYAADLAGFVYCLDAATGQRHWRYDMQAAVWGTPLVVDGKVILGNADGDVAVLQHGKELKELARNEMKSAVYGTAAVADNTLYIATQKAVYAIGTGDTTSASDRPPVTSAPASAPTTHPAAQSAPTSAPTKAVPAFDSAPTPNADPNGWCSFRGNAQLTGVSTVNLAAAPRRRWQYDLGDTTSCTAAIVDGTVYVGCGSGRFVALELKNGQRKWQQQTDEPIESSPAVLHFADKAVGGLVVYGDEAGVVRACDVRNGDSRWTFKADDRVISSPTVSFAPPLVIFGSYDTFLYALNPTDGKLVWKYELGERIHGTASIVGEHVLVAACDAHLHVVNLADGKLVRKVLLESVSGSAAAALGERAFVGTYGNFVTGVDWQAGRVLWRFEDPNSSLPFMSSAAVTPASVFIGGRDKRMRALDPATGKLQWEFATKGRIDSSPVIVTGQGGAAARAFFGSADGNLYALDARTGAEVWRYECGGAISASPAIGDGCLVIGTEAGTLLCFQ